MAKRRLPLRATLSLLLRARLSLPLTARLSLPPKAMRRNLPMAMKSVLQRARAHRVLARPPRALPCGRFHPKPRVPRSPSHARLPPLL